MPTNQFYNAEANYPMNFNNSPSQALTIITNENYTVLKASQPVFFKAFDGKSIREHISFPLEHDHTQQLITKARMNNVNYSVNILPLFSNGEISGYHISFFTLKDIHSLHINDDYSNSVFEDQANIRTQVSSIYSSAVVLHDCLEKNELYDEIKYLNQQVDSCCKILAASQNNNELAKYYLGIFNIVRIDIGKFTKNILTFVSGYVRQDNVSLECIADDNIFVNVDVERYVVMLFNLIVNGIAYNLEEKKIISISVKQQGNNAIISVVDNGSGMSAYQKSKVLNTDVLYDNQLSSDQKSGYGFYTIKEFCKAFNGSLILSSKENCGTTVSIRLPVCDSEGITEYAQSKTSDYLSNRFSPVYIALSKIIQIKFF